MKTWIRVEDEFAQFDHPKGAKLPKGVTKVKDYPEHTGKWAREPKRRTNKGGKQATRTAEAPPADADPKNASSGSK